MDSTFFKKYSEIDEDYLKCDFHMHSTWTDGEAGIQEIIEKAKSVGLNKIAITDHIRNGSTYFDNYYSEIKELSIKNDFQVLAGFEAKVNNFSGEIDVSSDNLKKADISICSVHRFPIGRKLIAATEFSSEISQRIELELSLAAIKKGGFNVLGHPGGMSIKAHGDFKNEYFEEIVSACASNLIAFDFNGTYHAKHVNCLIDLFKKYNPLISIGSDAHILENIGIGTKLFL
jgi:putative hydrolase